MYITHRSGLRKLGLAALVAAPALLFLLLMALSSAGLVHFPRDNALSDTAAVSPIPTAGAGDLEVLELAVERVPLSVTGAVRNRSGRWYQTVHVALYVLDRSGSRVGSVTARLREVAPDSEMRFRAPISDARAHSVLVREVWGF